MEMVSTLEVPAADAPGHDRERRDECGQDQTPEQHVIAGLLASMAETLTLIATGYPTWSLPEDAVGDVLTNAQLVQDMSQALTAVLVREADERGLGAEDGLSRTDWVKAKAPHLDVAQASGLTVVGAAMREPRWATLAAKVSAGEVPVSHAAVIVRFHDDVARIADPQHLSDIVDELVRHAEVFTSRELKRLVSHARATLKPPAELDQHDAAMRRSRVLTKVGKSAGMTEYRLRLDPEGAAVLDAAIDPLARPRPDLGWDGVEKGDPRTPANRRADALLELLGCAVASPEGLARTERTKLVITMSADALLGRLRGAGIAADDEILSPSTVRRLACDASIIPIVLGGPSEVLDVGRQYRFFTPAQRRALTIRDKGCSFPGCTIPPQWCEAHHVEHWIDGGPTDLLNAALLCGRHHTVVHGRGLTASINASGVTWHL
jgi:hypothetical protein